MTVRQSIVQSIQSMTVRQSMTVQSIQSKTVRQSIVQSIQSMTVRQSILCVKVYKV